MLRPKLGLSARATVRRVVDGDTLELFILGIPVMVRLLDCWCAETRGDERYEGLVAKAYLEELAPPDFAAQVWIPTEHATKLQHVFTFGRILGHVWLGDAEQSVSEMMVAAGLATRTKPDG